MTDVQRSRRPRRWSPLLTVHAAAVAISGSFSLVLLAVGLEGLGGIGLQLVAMLALPWGLFVYFLPLPWVGMSDINETLIMTATAVFGVAVHWLALAVVREHRYQRGSAPDSAAPGMTSAPAPYPLGLLGGCILLGAGIWAAWLGWDTTYYAIPGRPGLHGPYTQVQVAACALTVGLATTLLTLRNDPQVTALGISLGFGAGWTVSASVTSDGPGIAIGAGLLGIALATGTALAASIGYLARRPLEARRARRGALVTRT